MEDSDHPLYRYRTYEEAIEGYDTSDRWAVFDGSPDEFNITHECLDRHDDSMTAVRVIKDDGATESYSVGSLTERSGRFANALAAHGVDRDDRVAVMLEPSRALYVSMFGVWKRGAVYVPMFNLFGPQAIEYRIEDSEADILVTTAEKAAEDVPDDLDVELVLVGDGFEAFYEGYDAAYTPDTSADDVSVLQYTSGTTGQPKAYPMRHKSLTQCIVTLAFGYGLRPDERYICASPPAWAHGLWMGTAGPLALGTAAGAYAGKYTPAALLDGLESLEIENLAAAATALRKLAHSGLLDDYDLSLRKITTTGEPMDSDTYEFLRNELGVSIADIYGISEYGPFIMNYNGFDDWEPKPDSIGKPLPGVEAAVIGDDGETLPPGEIGEIAVRHQGEWLRSGDAGSVDAAGYFYHKGRVGDVIISSGWRIDPHEVEDMLMQHPAVAECAVVASPDETRGHIVKAFVRTDEPGTDALIEELQQLVKDELSAHEYPREIEFVDDFPYTESGKIKRKTLREQEEAADG